MCLWSTSMPSVPLRPKTAVIVSIGINGKNASPPKAVACARAIYVDLNLVDDMPMCRGMVVLAH